MTIERLWFALCVIVAIVSVTLFIDGYLDCNKRGGIYVKPIFGLYSCIDAKK